MNKKSLSFHFVTALLFFVSASCFTTNAHADNANPITPVAAAKSAGPLPIKDGSIEFYAIGKPSMLKIHGASSKMTGTMNRDGSKLSGVLEIPLDSFETGMSVRNSHLKDKVFETSKFTSAKLTISSLVLPAGQTGEMKDLPFTGKLSLHGVEKDISGTATVNPGDASVSFTADFQVKMSDYQIPPPEFMGMSMQDEVKVSAKGEAKSSS